MSRKDKKVKGSTVKTGRICSVCGKFVLNLNTHVARIHCYSKDSPKFQDVVENSTECEKGEHYRVEFEVNHNPLATYSVHNSLLNYDLATKIIDKDEGSMHMYSSTNALNNDMRKDVYDFGSEHSDYSNELLLNPKDTFNMNNIKMHISEDFLNAVVDFKAFLSTDWGGTTPEKSIDMDIANIFKLVNCTGEKSFWDPHQINKHLTKDTILGKTPVTIHSRIRSLRRFVGYLKSIDSAILPEANEINRLLFMMGGVEKSLLKKRNRHQKNVMKKNRDNFEHTIEVLKEWRKKRVSFNKLYLFDRHCHEQNTPLTSLNYQVMRDFLICEILIPNAQRAGIIPGIIIDEILKAKTQVACGYHRIMVSDHKTGYLQSATLFLSSPVFKALVIFIESVLPKLPIHSSNNSQLSCQSHVFQTFSGKILTSPFITPIVRSFLMRMDISYRGTITDFRRAAATLTGKRSPALSEIMAQFMGHSRRVHDRHYRIQYGINGLLGAYKQLEYLQINPILNDSLPNIIDENSSYTLSDFLDTCNSDPNELEMGLTNLTNAHKDADHNTRDDVEICSSTMQSLDYLSNDSVLSDLTGSNTQSHFDNSDDSLTCHSGGISSSGASIQLANNHKSSLLTPIDSQSTPLNYSHMTISDSNMSYDDSLTNKEIDYTIVIDDSNNQCDLENDCSFECLDIFNDISFDSNSPKSLDPPNKLPTMECSLLLVRLSRDVVQSFTKRSKQHAIISNLTQYISETSDDFDCESGYQESISDTNTTVPHYRTIFHSRDDENVFLKVFSDFITKVENRIIVTKRAIIERAITDIEFAPVLSRLQIGSGHLDGTFQRIHNRIRTVGNSRRKTKLGTNGTNCNSDVSSSVNYRRRNVFQNAHDEKLFKEIFSDLIIKVAKKEIVRRRDILDRAYNDIRFAPTLANLKGCYPGEDIDLKICNKVRSIGHSFAIF